MTPPFHASCIFPIHWRVNEVYTQTTHSHTTTHNTTHTSTHLSKHPNTFKRKHTHIRAHTGSPFYNHLPGQRCPTTTFTRCSLVTTPMATVAMRHRRLHKPCPRRARRLVWLCLPGAPGSLLLDVGLCVQVWEKAPATQMHTPMSRRKKKNAECSQPPTCPHPACILFFIIVCVQGWVSTLLF